MLIDVALVLTTLVVLRGLLGARVRNHTYWHAMVTPLASIIGSGFLVSVPLLSTQLGTSAIWGMLALVVFTYWLGGAIRFNITFAEPLLQSPAQAGVVHRLLLGAESVSELALALAYMVSVAYYLSLLSVFALSGLGLSGELLGRWVTSALLVTIGIIGLGGGLKSLENLEVYAVGFKLAVIVAILVGLLWYNTNQLAQGTWQLPALPAQISVDTLRQLGGLLIVVQGFETSRYLGKAYSPGMRVATMRSAQQMAALIYMLFFAGVTVLMQSQYASGEVAAMIDVVGHVATVLPLMLIGAAVASQFSAAVADAIGGAAIVESAALPASRAPWAYPLLAAFSLALVWSGSVLDIIAWASRAFATYYALQAVVATLTAAQAPGVTNRGLRVCWFAGLGITCAAAAVLATPVAA